MSFMLGLKPSSVINQKIVADYCVKKLFLNKRNIRTIGSLTCTAQFSKKPSDCCTLLKSTYCVNRKDINMYNKVFYSNLPEELDSVSFESICAETLDSLCEWFDEIIESTPELKSADVTFGDGVLTVNLGTHGTYVINRQSPNKQIWLSSPTSGPKRYDFVPDRKGWVYRHDNQTLHNLLKTEISHIIKSPVDLSHCAYFCV